MTDQTRTLGPLNPARLREWVIAAKPGARLIYARGPSCVLGCSAAVRDFVQRLSGGCSDDQGRTVEGLNLVTAHFQRGTGGEGQYLIQRTQRPVPRGFVL